MPLWQIYHSKGTFEDVETKQAFVNDITSYYTLLPPFYVVVQFFPMPLESTWRGGEAIAEKPFVRIVINHVAIVASDSTDDAETYYKRVSGRINEVVTPHIYDKGYDAEWHVYESDRRLWRLDGLIAPPFRSETEKEWKAANKALPWAGDH